MLNQYTVALRIIRALAPTVAPMSSPQLSLRAEKCNLVASNGFVAKLLSRSFFSQPGNQQLDMRHFCSFDISERLRLLTQKDFCSRLKLKATSKPHFELENF